MFHALNINFYKFIVIKSVTIQQCTLQEQRVPVWLQATSVCTEIFAVSVHACRCSSSLWFILLIIWYCLVYSASKYWLWTSYSLSKMSRVLLQNESCFSWKRQRTHEWVNTLITTSVVDYGKQRCLWCLIQCGEIKRGKDDCWHPNDFMLAFYSLAVSSLKSNSWVFWKRKRFFLQIRHWCCRQ